MYLGKALKSVFVGKAQRFLHAAVGKGPITGICSGTVVTVLVQSSSTTTSLIVPLAGSGVIRLRQVYPFTLGANIGTTITALLAATAITGPTHAVAHQIAIAHFLYNLVGVIAIYASPGSGTFRSWARSGLHGWAANGNGWPSCISSLRSSVFRRRSCLRNRGCPERRRLRPFDRLKRRIMHHVFWRRSAGYGPHRRQLYRRREEDARRGHKGRRRAEGGCRRALAGPASRRPILCQDYRKPLGRDDVDVVIGTLPHWLHYQAALDAVAAGKHVFMEKPLAAWAWQAEEMLAAARENDVRLMTAHTQRYFPAVKAMKDVVDRGDLGSVIMVYDMWHKPYVPYNRPEWMLGRERGGGMGQMDGTHQIDRLLWILGNDVATVSARQGQFTYPKSEHRPSTATIPACTSSDGRAESSPRSAASRGRGGATEYGGDWFFTMGMARFRLPYGGGRPPALFIADTPDGTWRRETRAPIGTAWWMNSRNLSNRSNGATRIRRYRRFTA